jgi:hypothetical protein
VYLGCNNKNKNEAMLFKWVINCVCIQVNSRPTNMAAVTFSLIARIGILSGRLACGNGNEKTLVLQWTNKKSKARKNKLIVANQVLLKDNYVSNVIKQKVLRKYLKNAKMC